MKRRPIYTVLAASAVAIIAALLVGKVALELPEYFASWLFSAIAP